MPCGSPSCNDEVNRRQRGRLRTTEQLALVFAARSAIDLASEFERCMTMLSAELEQRLGESP